MEVRISFSAIIIKAGPWTASIFARRRIWIYPNTGYKKWFKLKKNKILIGTKEQGIYLYDYCTQQLTRFTSDIHHLLISLYVVSDKYVYASFLRQWDLLLQPRWQDSKVLYIKDFFFKQQLCARHHRT